MPSQKTLLPDIWGHLKDFQGVSSKIICFFKLSLYNGSFVFRLLAISKVLVMKPCSLFFILLLTSLLGFAGLPPKASEVFQLSTHVVDPNTFLLDWQIKPGFFLYREPIQLTESQDSNFHLGNLSLPPPQQHTDQQGKKTLVYRNHLTLPIAILGNQAGEALLTVHYQGCSDDGFCYPPVDQPIKIAIDQHLALNSVTMENQANTARAPVIPVSTSDSLALLFSTNSWGMILLSFFGFGLLLSFTPCILPMVPILSGIIVGHGHDVSTRKAFLLSLSYVLSMSVTYAIIGALVALMGSNLQMMMQSTWTTGLFGLLFVLLALSMFGFYELHLPLTWQTKLANVTRSHSGGHYLGSALMGCLSILILSPCVTAPMIGALSYIAQSGDIVLGSLSLFFLSLGMGTPLLLMGLSAGKLLPKAGHWMNAIKSFFGVMLLAVALYLIDRLLPPFLMMSLWSALLVISSVHMGALNKARSNIEKSLKGLGVMLLVYGILILVGASQGNINPLQPLASLPNNESLEKSSVITVTTLNEAKQALKHAKGKPVLMDFYADWCTSCKIMAKTTLQDPRIIQKLHEMIVLTVDLTANDAEAHALLNHYHVVAPPTFLFFDADGNESEQQRLVGEISADTFYTHLIKIWPTLNMLNIGQ
jgi:thiol:disulfide interchange protein DsbD